MSTTRTSHRLRPVEELTATAEDAVFDEASRLLGLRRQDARRVHHHASTVYVLPSEDAVVRIRRSSFEQDRRAIMVSHWLVEQGFPATQPLGVEQPVTLGAWTATCWRYYPQVGRPPPEPRHLGRLLRRLHDLAPPPLELPRYTPLASLVRSVRSTEFLPDDDRNWLLERSEHLLDVYEGLDSPLGHGHIHGDAYPGNLLWNSAQVLLGDWDETSVGPRELDLVNTYQGVRFGRTELELSEFAAAYGHDVARWRGFSTLRAIRDLHTLGAYLRRGDRGDQAARHQVLHRIDTLRRGKLTARWSTG